MFLDFFTLFLLIGIVILETIFIYHFYYTRNKSRLILGTIWLLGPFALILPKKVLSILGPVPLTTLLVSSLICFFLLVNNIDTILEEIKDEHRDRRAVKQIKRAATAKEEPEPEYELEGEHFTKEEYEILYFDE